MRWICVACSVMPLGCFSKRASDGRSSTERLLKLNAIADEFFTTASLKEGRLGRLMLWWLDANTVSLSMEFFFTK